MAHRRATPRRALVRFRNRRNVVLTGMARGGTTLACRLINGLPDAVALVEPILPRELDGLSGEELPDAVERFFGAVRRSAVRRGVVPSVHADGSIPDNPFAQEKAPDGTRPSLVERGEIPVGKRLPRRFWVVAKDPTLFTALLPLLVRRFPCYALVRNPLAVLASRTSVRGAERMEPPSLRFDPAALKVMRSIEDPVDQHLHLLDWGCRRFAGHLPARCVIRYEDVVASGGAALSAAVPAARGLSEPLANRNANPLYDRAEVERIAERLLASDGAYWRYYSRREVEDLLAAVAR